MDAIPRHNKHTNRCRGEGMGDIFFSPSLKEEWEQTHTHVEWETGLVQQGFWRGGVWGWGGVGLGEVGRGDRKDGDCRWTLKRNALTHELSSENADNASLLTDPGSPSRLYLILPQHAFLVWGDKTPKHTDRQWPKAQTKKKKKKIKK